MWFVKNGRRKLVQTSPEETPSCMEGPEYAESRRAINQRNAARRRAEIERMTAAGWALVGG